MSFTKHKKILIAAAILIVIAISSGLYLNNSSKTIQSAKQQTENNAQNVLDCSKKVAQDKSYQVAKNKNAESDCLFLGCGDFF